MRMNGYRRESVMSLRISEFNYFFGTQVPPPMETTFGTLPRATLPQFLLRIPIEKKNKLMIVLKNRDPLAKPWTGA